MAWRDLTKCVVFGLESHGPIVAIGHDYEGDEFAICEKHLNYYSRNRWKVKMLAPPVPVVPKRRRILTIDRASIVDTRKDLL